MSADLERAIRSYAEYLDETLPTVTTDEIRTATTDRPERARPPLPWYRSPVVVFAAAMAAVLLIALVPLLLSGRGADVVETPTTATPAPDAAPTTLPPSTTALSPPEALVQVDTSGDDLWAWEYDGNRVWRYADGRWEELPPVSVSSVVSIDGTPWALTDGVVRYLDGDTWHQSDIPASFLVWRIAADASSETLWLSTGERLYRWDGEAVTEIDVDVVDSRYPDYTYVGEIAVTSDGTVWAAGLYGYAPMLGVLASYEPTTGTWEAVKPWNGKPVPAGLLAATSTGGLWVLLEDWDDDESADGSYKGWALAYRDGDTERWEVHEEDLPLGRPFAIAADSDGVWLAQGYALVEGSEPMLGLYHFDGLAWTRYLEEVEVLDVAISPDGTVWYMTDQEPYILRPLEP